MKKLSLKKLVLFCLVTCLMVGMLGGEAFAAGKPARVTAINVEPGRGLAIVSWNKAANATAYQVYMKKPGSSSFSLLKKTKFTSITVKKLRNGKKYSFKVRAMNGSGKSKFSAAKTVKISEQALAVTGLKYIVSASGSTLGIEWSPSKGADSYEVMYKGEGETEFTSLKTVRKTKYAFHDPIDYNKTYTFIVYALKGTSRGKASKEMTVNPNVYLKEHRQEMLAQKVRTIAYLPNKKCKYTKKNYTDEVKEAFVNYKGLSSKTKYLIWASLYTQQVTIYTGSKGHWKMLKTCDCASGSWNDRTPRGTHKLTFRESKWQHSGWKTMYVTHFYKKASFHARPKYNNGKIKDPRIGKPISNACIRVPDDIAKFIHKMPLGTTVKVY